MARKHYYKHLDEEEVYNISINLNMEQVAKMVYEKNYGLHRFLSEIIDIQRKSEYEQEHKFADELEALLNKGRF